jgi:hypothetical protein
MHTCLLSLLHSCILSLSQLPPIIPSPQGTYNYNSWLPLAGGSDTLSEASQVQALNTYTVTVKTSDLRNADFDGKVRVRA